MKQLTVIVGLAAILAFGFDYAGMLSSLTAKPDGDGITVEWRSDIESGIRSYSIERSDARSENDFQSAGTVMPTGNYSQYRFHDAHPLMISANGQSARPQADAFKYRVRVNLASGEVSYSGTVNVTKPSSGVRRTWGMIKEMFH
jgi:hypothetical protein